MSQFPPRPSVPTPYLAGTISVPAGGKASGVLQLIWDQLDPNCPGTSVEYRISGDPSNTTPVFIGSGDVSCDNYGAIITAMGEERRYRASYPGTGTPQGMQRVWSEAPAKLHVEINT